MNYSTLFFVGNGFDIAADYATSYSDFYKSAQFENLIKDENSIALYVKNKVSIKNWADLEQELYNYAMENLPNSSQERFKEHYDSVKSALYHYIGTVSYYRHDRLSDQLLRIQRFLKQLYNEDENIQFVSFNYTTIFDDLWKETTKQTPKIKHVHGNVDNSYLFGDKIVLGIDESMSVASEYNFLYKTFSTAYDNFDISKAISDAKRIIIFGCSMGDSDRWYFEQIFNNCSGKIVEIHAFGDSEIINCRQRIKELTNSTNLANLTTKMQLKTFDNTSISQLTQAREDYYKYDNPDFLDSLKADIES